ncbi:flagellar assembly protein FliH [Pistricoccus aurantiacus]|uniref:flagellar assembly protein FliH n=1 Tax=Pistricoccus aurantiacus TaxID=1883414 RepID=UPI00364063CE
MSETRIRHPRHWQRWQMDDLASRIEERRQERTDNAESQQATKRTDALEAERQAVRQQAHEAGYAEGHEEGRKDGYAKGLEEGRAQGLQELEQQSRQTLAALLPLIESFNQALAQRDEKIADSLVELALATGHQLAGEALKETPEQIVEIVRELLHLEPALSGHPRLRLHPQDLTLVKDIMEQELATLGWRLQADDQLTRGGCRVTSDSGELDATWEQRCAGVMEQIRRRSTVRAAESES